MIWHLALGFSPPHQRDERLLHARLGGAHVLDIDPDLIQSCDDGILALSGLVDENMQQITISLHFQDAGQGF